MLSANSVSDEGARMKKSRYLVLHLSFLFILATLPAACEEKEFDANDPSGSFATAKEPYDNENYDIAIQKLGEFKSRFPYSKFTAQAELLIANAHFQLEHYEEAANAYGQFAKLHPKHEQVEFAMYRVGESYWADAPEEIDRDQEYTVKAIEEWGKLVQKTPDSKYAQDARVKMTAGTRRLALADEFIANFYCKLEKYHACAYKFTQLLEKFPQFVDLHKNALTKAAYAFDKLADKKREDPESDKNIYFKLYTVDELLAKAQDLRGRLASLK